MEVSNRSQLGYTHLSRIENDSTVPNPATVVKIANVLDADVTLMLRLADNLPKAILDRLSSRSARTEAPALHRAMPPHSQDGSTKEARSLDALVRQAELSTEEVIEMQDAVEGLLRLPAIQRRLISDLISSYFSEGDDPTG
jgi:transcriptional regulator with XRE-family HTH domain